MTAQPCRCEELEAVVERMRQVIDEAILCRHASNCQGCLKRFHDVLESHTLSSILARREAARAVVEAAREEAKTHEPDDDEEQVPCHCELCDALAHLDAQLEKEKA